jgi:hypothetical protein
LAISEQTQADFSEFQTLIVPEVLDIIHEMIDECFGGTDGGKAAALLSVAGSILATAYRYSRAATHNPLSVDDLCDQLRVALKVAELDPIGPYTFPPAKPGITH